MSGSDDDVWAALEADIGQIGSGAGNLFRQPLWLNYVKSDPQYKTNIPDWIRSVIDDFDKMPLVVNGSWGVLNEWYRSILPNRAGPPASLFGQDLDLALARNGAAFWDRDPNKVVSELDWLAKNRPLAASVESLNLSDEIAATAIPPEPALGPGPSYSPSNGKLSEEVSPPAEGEVESQAGVHAHLASGAAKLAEDLRGVSNRFPELANAAQEYAELLSTKIEDADVVGIWSVGGALVAFAQSYREQNAARTLSEPLEPHLAAQLQNVVRQHGAFVMGFAEGRDLVQRSDEFAVDRARLAELEASGAPLIDELTTNLDLVDERTRRLHAPVRDSVLELGWSASRVGYSAYLIIRNCVRAMIKYTVGEHPNVGEIIALVMGTSALLGDPNAQFVRAAVPVLLQNSRQLLAFFNHSPEMLAYVQWALDLLERDRDANDET